MKKLLVCDAWPKISVAALLIFLGACAPSEVPLKHDGRPLVIRNADIVDVRSGELKPRQTVVIDRQRIAAVGPSTRISVPDGAEIVEGEGRYLIPGLWDMHAHTSSDEISRQIVLPLFIANGVTGIRNMVADCLEASTSSCSSIEVPIGTTKRWRQEIAAGTLVGPRIVAGSSMVHGPDPGDPSTVYDPATAEHGRAHARLLASRDVDFIKIYDELSREAFSALADEANQLGIPFAGHVPVAVRASEAARAGQRTIEHCCAGSLFEECSSREPELRAKIVAEIDKDSPRALPILLEMIESYDERKCEDVIRTFVENDTWFVPTLSAAQWQGDWHRDPRVQFLPQREREFMAGSHAIDEKIFGTGEERRPVIQHSYGLLMAMKEAGVRILAGSDPGVAGIFFGSSLAEELGYLVDAGFSEAEALRAATLSAAEFLERTGDLGTIEPGKLADLVLLDGNPLEDIANVSRVNAVVANGRLFDRGRLDELLASAQNAAQRID